MNARLKIGAAQYKKSLSTIHSKTRKESPRENAAIFRLENLNENVYVHVALQTGQRGAVGFSS